MKRSPAFVYPQKGGVGGWKKPLRCPNVSLNVTSLGCNLLLHISATNCTQCNNDVINKHNTSPESHVGSV